MSDIENTSRLGEGVTFDDVDLYAYFEADLISWEYTPGAVTSTFRRDTGKTGFNLYDFDYPSGTLALKLYVRGDDRASMFKNVSKLVAAAKSPRVEIQGETGVDSMRYNAVLSDYSVEQEDIEWYCMVTLSFEAIRYHELMTYTNTSAAGVALMNNGTLETGLKIKFKAASALAKLIITVSGADESQVITFTSPANGMWYTIDGMTGVVTDANGINKILYTDLARFPKIAPGLCTVQFSANVASEISFYQVYQV